MDSKLPFDRYETAAVIVPGAVVAFTILSEWPSLANIVPGDDSTLGGFTILALVTFVAGHLLQTLGSLLHATMWKLAGGMPTEWVVTGKGRLLSPDQFYRLAEAIERMSGRRLDSYRKDRRAWYAVTREIYSLISAAERTDRIDAFNRTYGMLRGIATAFAIGAVVLALHEPNPSYAIAAGVLTSLAIVRAVQFGKNYARELFIEYLHTTSTSADQDHAKARRSTLRAVLGNTIEQHTASQSTPQRPAQ